MEAQQTLSTPAQNAGPTAPGTKTPWSVQDRACDHCRDRKIRCGREKPQCSNCKRDSINCVYANFGKRVNHIKLLCGIVDNLDDRMGDIERGLSNLSTIIREARRCELCTSVDLTEDQFSDTSPGDDVPSTPPPDRHIIRSKSDFADHYHGPSSLFALCNEFSQDTLSSPQIQRLLQVGGEPQANCQQDMSAEVENLKFLLERLCHEAVEETVDNDGIFLPIRLPPKQFLLMAQSQLFSQADYTTNIFVQSSFCSQVDRLYSRPYNPADEAWAVCFNTIILLVLGSEATMQGSDPLAESQFASPFRLMVLTAINNPQALMKPKLINVQALALLSIAAEMYSSASFSESMFTQACMLAKRMGIHQRPRGTDTITSEEAHERFKVFRSLYLRDKHDLIFNGSICWLPTFDSKLSDISNIDSADHDCSSRIQLATLQEDIYRSFHSAKSQNESLVKSKSSLKLIEQNLESLANGQNIFSFSRSDPNIRNINLQLEFLATRISAFYASSEVNHTSQRIIDSRASCMLLLLSYGKHEESIYELLETLLPPQKLSKYLSDLDNSRSERCSSSGTAPSTQSGIENPSELARFSTLPNTFPVVAFFVLARHVLLSEPGYPQLEDDISLLSKVCECFQELDAKTRANNRIHNIGRVFARLLEIIHLIRKSQGIQSSPPATDSTNNPTALSSNENNLDSPPNLADFTHLLTPEGHSTLYTQPSEEDLSMLAVSSLATDLESFENFHNLLPLMDRTHAYQQLDSPQQYLLSPFPAENMGKRKRSSAM